jgi:hypothetical protein
VVVAEPVAGAAVTSASLMESSPAGPAAAAATTAGAVGPVAAPIAVRPIVAAVAAVSRSRAAGGESAGAGVDPAVGGTAVAGRNAELDHTLVDRMAASSGAVSGLDDVVAAMSRALAVFPPAGVRAASDWDVLELQSVGAVGRRSPASSEVVVAASARSARVTVSITKPGQPGEPGTVQSRLASSPVGAAAGQLLGGELTAAVRATEAVRATAAGRAVGGGGVTPGRGGRPGVGHTGGGHGTDADGGSPPGEQDALAARIARTLRLVVDEWRWSVVPGAFVTRAGRCSCGDRACAEPGTHLVDRTRTGFASGGSPARWPR